MITKDQLFVQGELVANVADIKASNTALVEPLREKLKAPRIIGDIGEKDLANREITVMADKSLPYEILKKVMATCTDADYGKISLAVLQKEKPVPARLQAGVRGRAPCCSRLTTVVTSSPGKAIRSRAELIPEDPARRADRARAVRAHLLFLPPPKKTHMEESCRRAWRA